MTRVSKYSGMHFPFRITEVVNKILAMVVAVAEISKAMCLSPQKAFLSHCLIILSHIFYSVVTSLNSKELD